MTDTRAVAQMFMDRICAGNAMAAFGMLATDGIYTLIGSTGLSGVYRGRDDLLKRLIPIVSTFVKAPKMIWEAPIIEGDRAVLIGSGLGGEGPTGPYQQPHYLFVTRVRGDEFVEVTEYMDTVMVETAMFGKILVDA